jgi:phospholipase D1/2
MVRKSLKAHRPSYKNTRPVPWKMIFGFVLLLMLPLLWRWTPLQDWINLATILEWQKSLRGDAAAPLYVVAVYLVGSLVFFPITILTLATVFAFGPLWGNVYALLGWILSAAEGYFLGHLIGETNLHRLAGERLGHLIDSVQHHGFLTVLALRIVPLAPFTLVNMFIGASGIQCRDFVLGSLVGRVPGILTMALFGVQIENALRDPGLLNFALLGAVVIALPWLFARLFRRLNRRSGARS